MALRTRFSFPSQETFWFSINPKGSSTEPPGKQQRRPIPVLLHFVLGRTSGWKTSSCFCLPLMDPLSRRFFLFRSLVVLWRRCFVCLSPSRRYPRRFLLHSCERRRRPRRLGSEVEWRKRPRESSHHLRSVRQAPVVIPGTYRIQLFTERNLSPLRRLEKPRNMSPVK